MNTNRQTAVIKGVEHPHTNRRSAVKLVEPPAKALFVAFTAALSSITKAITTYGDDALSCFYVICDHRSANT
jgi:hypothetical protein